MNPKSCPDVTMDLTMDLTGGDAPFLLLGAYSVPKRN